MPDSNNDDNLSQSSLSTRVGDLSLDDSAIVTDQNDPSQPSEAAGEKGTSSPASTSSQSSTSSQESASSCSSAYRLLKSMTPAQRTALMQQLGATPAQPAAPVQQAAPVQPAAPVQRAAPAALPLQPVHKYDPDCYFIWHEACITQNELQSPPTWSPFRSTAELDQAQAYLDLVTVALDEQLTEPQRLQFTVKFRSNIAKAQMTVPRNVWENDAELATLFQNIQKQLSSKMNEARTRYSQTQREQQKRLPMYNTVPLIDLNTDSDFNSFKDKIKEEFSRSQFHQYYQFAFTDIVIAKAVKETAADKLHYRVTGCVTALTKLKDKKSTQELQGLTFEDIFAMPAFKTDTIINYALREAMAIKRSGKMTADEHLPAFEALWTRAMDKWHKQSKEHGLTPEQLLELIHTDMMVAKALATFHKGYEGELDAMVRARKLNGTQYWTDFSEIEKCIQELTAINDKACRKEPKPATTAAPANSTRKRPAANTSSNGASSGKRPRTEQKPTVQKWTCTRPCATCKKDATQNFHRDVRKDGKDVPCPDSPTHPKYVAAVEKVRKARPEMFKTQQ